MRRVPKLAFTPQQIFSEFQAFERTLALRTAIELDLFTHIARGRKTVVALAKATRSSARGIEILCDCLTALGHLGKSRKSYTLPSHSRLFLNARSATYIGSAIRFLADDPIIEAFLHLHDAVRTGSGGKNSLRHNDHAWVEFAHNMAAPAEPVAASAACALMKAIDCASDKEFSVLDLAAGHGLYGLAVASLHRNAQIFALDSAPVLAVAAENARKRGLEKRWSAIPGNSFQKNFGGPYDLILVVNFTHHLDQNSNELLFRKCHDVLKPGGRLAIIDFVLNEDRISPSRNATFALHLLATTLAGTVYTFRQLAGMLRAAKYKNVRRIDFGSVLLMTAEPRHAD
jgi:2-polyprenyl-3-methyl-5-hydroxy-6-metoxy-1,4-benzoquinol methylase